MKKIIILILSFLFFIQIQSNCQIDFEKGTFKEDPIITLFSLDIKILPDSVKNEALRAGGIFNFKGLLRDGLLILLGKEEDRVEFIGSIPKGYISFSSYQLIGVPCSILDNILTAYAKYYKFHIEEKDDYCNAWVIKKSFDFDKKKRLYSPISDGNNAIRFLANTKQWKLTGVPLNIFINYFSQHLHFTVINEISDSELYNFLIPQDSMSSKEKLSKYLLEEYGLELKTENRLEKFKIVIFED